MPANRIAPLVTREGLGGPYWLLTFRHPEVAHEARAGQFVMIKAGTSAEPPLRRPFSIMLTDPGAETFTLFIKDVGPGSGALCALEAGDEAQCLGPLGQPFSPPPEGTEALFVAGGYGVAPFRLFGEELKRTGGRHHLFYGGRTVDDLPLRERLEAAGLNLVATTEDGSHGHRGRVTTPLVAHLDASQTPARLYACGPEPMLHAVARLADERDLVAEVSLDPWMGCGIGTCLGCVVRVQDAEEERGKYRCACTEGPVFDAARVQWPGEDASRARRAATGAGA
ncbi:MAG: dihydroorotate dehydrogenase electron transfer subunit [Synechococcaceae cyanobacterium]|nr:dihydroorotate dehydrogenase electron transfer subunit [Synechococcaceae cyanobacterium]